MRGIEHASKVWIGLFVVIVILSSCATGQTGTPVPVTPEPFEGHAVLAYGEGRTTTDWTDGNAFVFFALPELTVYDNGLVLFSCRQEAWPEICQRRVAPEQIGRLWDELNAIGVLDGSDHDYTNAQLGPRTYFALEARGGVIHWASAAVGYPPNCCDIYLIESIQAVLTNFTKEAMSAKQLYQPKYAALWIVLWDKCPTGNPTDCDIPWPFEFSPKVAIPAIISDDENCSKVEVPQSIAEIRSAIFDFEKHSLGDRYFFRDGNNIVEVQIRPYLPGERMLIMCALRRYGRISLQDYPSYLYFMK